MERATRIAVELLAKGSSISEVAELTDNSVQAVSQVAERYRDKILAGKEDQALAGGNHSQQLDRLERLAASKLEGVLALETDGLKILRIFQGLNSAIRRDAGEKGGVGGTTVEHKVVQINMPQHLTQHLEVLTNMNNDVVAVGGRDLTPASMNYVNQLAGIAIGGTEDDAIRRQAFDDILQAPLAR